jgi:pyruvate formate lyase activating enzyme
MSQTLVGSRYDLHVARRGAAESKKSQDYFAIHPGDLEECKEGADVTGFVHSWEVGTTVDGPGIRLVAFLTGCPLRCQYCHNPDTWHKYNGRPITVLRAMQVIGRYAKVLQLSKGGVTLSGGEPQMQRKFVTEVFHHCKEYGLHTCLDTSGRLGAQFTDEELMDIDLHLLDIKSGDPAIFEKVARQPLQPTLDFARRLSSMERALWIRYVLVAGLTDGEDNVQRVADFCATLETVQRVEILRFHQMGRDKWHRLGLDYPLEGVEPPSVEVMARVREQFRSRGLTVH